MWQGACVAWRRSKKPTLKTIALRVAEHDYVIFYLSKDGTKTTGVLNIM
jgi:hypothetical protein